MTAATHALQVVQKLAARSGRSRSALSSQAFGDAAEPECDLEAERCEEDADLSYAAIFKHGGSVKPPPGPALTSQALSRPPLSAQAPPPPGFYGAARAQPLPPPPPLRAQPAVALLPAEPAVAPQPRQLVPWNACGDVALPQVVPLAPPRPMPARGGGRSYSSTYMTAEECAGILRIQWAATHPHSPATPEQLRYGFNGLGAVAVGNVARPRQLLQLLEVPPGHQGVPVDYPGGLDCSLDAHPRVALRLLVEDAHGLLADAACADVACKAALLAALTSQVLNNGCSDGILAAVASLGKGRGVLAALLSAGATDILAAICRNLARIFSDAPTDSYDRSFAALATSAGGAARLLDAEALLRLFGAVSVLPELDDSDAGLGCALLLEGLLSAATQRGLGSASQGWGTIFSAFFAMLSQRIAPAMRKAMQTRTMQGVPVALLKACLSHVSEAQRAQLRQFLVAISAV